MPKWIEEREIFLFEKRVWQLRASPSGSTVACADLDGRIHLIDLELRAELQQFEGATDSGSCVQLAFSPDGRFLASGQKRLRIWGLQSGVMHFEHMNGVRSIAYAPDGETLAVSVFGFIELWDTKSLTLKQTIPTEDWQSQINFSPDGNSLASTLKKSICVMELSNPERMKTMSVGAQANCVSFHPTEPWIGYSAFSRKLGIWNHQTKKKQLQLEMPDKGSWNLRFSPDGSLLVADTVHRLLTWDTRSGELLDVIERPLGWSLSMDFLPDGRLVMSDKELVVLYRFVP